MQKDSTTTKVVMTALMTGIIMVSIFLLRIPIPFTQGYVHLGDGMIFLAVLILGWRYGAVAAAFGGALGDLLVGFAMYAPATFVIKAVMAIVMGLFITLSAGKKRSFAAAFSLELVGMLLGGLLMVAGYYLAERVMFGNWVVPMLGVPWNVGQFIVGMLIAAALAAALHKTPAGKYFSYQLPKRGGAA